MYAELKFKGQVYIGDPAYILADSIYHDVWGARYGYETGVIETDSSAPEETRFVVGSTIYGDGEYVGVYEGEALEFMVDSGTIAAIPHALFSPNERDTVAASDNLGHILQVNSSVAFTEEDGVFSIEIDGKPLTINTQEDEEDEDERYESRTREAQAFTITVRRASEGGFDIVGMKGDQWFTGHFIRPDVNRLLDHLERELGITPPERAEWSRVFDRAEEYGSSYISVNPSLFIKYEEAFYSF